ncbi:biotin transporter BioY [Pseudosulfitobacter sp. DSM 107133]|uniref:biotin transporter BioY n=1 Tax=Pseudosulfitobacter sp. DSM 107133 TaxID=2883100 RepID=UPI000DF37982|nr:biotin transporter BioY [Pseudosulfitobacter sp. DSM 107133]UOA26805.1 Biotin transporter BioY [Pseudosulfitobacter sp. DSM 107133]
MQNRVLSDLLESEDKLTLRARQVIMVAGGILLLAVAAKVHVPMWPVPITMSTFAVLLVGAAYGAQLGLVTILGYLAVGALGLDVFAGSSAQTYGLNYMLGSSGGYLVGYVLATVILGFLANRGWGRSIGWMALAMLIANVAIYLPGLTWLGQLYGWDKPILAWGLIPFLPGDAVKLALAAVLLPTLWKLIDRVRG